MIIRKKFDFEGAHIVRNCSSTRCKFSIHGHSYTVEVFFSSIGFDNGQMVVDFGLMKGTIKDYIDSFDHAYSMWQKENDEFKNFIYQNSLRWIQMPVSPSAEAYSLMMLYTIDKIMKATEFNNGEKSPYVTAVRVHETATGYAEANTSDLAWYEYDLNDVQFSEGIISEWKDPEMYKKLIYATNSNEKCFINEIVPQQV